MVSVDIKHHVYLHTYLLPSDAATNESYRQQWGGKAARKQNKEQIQKCAAMWVNHDNYDNNCSDNVYSKHLICGWAMKYHRAQRQSETVSMSHVDFLKFWEEEKKKIGNSWGCCVWVDKLDPEPHVHSLIPFRSLSNDFLLFSLFFSRWLQQSETADRRQGWQRLHQRQQCATECGRGGAAAVLHRLSGSAGRHTGPLLENGVGGQHQRGHHGYAGGGVGESQVPQVLAAVRWPTAGSLWRVGEKSSSWVC